MNRMKDFSKLKSKKEVEKDLDICVKFWKRVYFNDRDKFIESLDSECINSLLDTWLELDKKSKNNNDGVCNEVSKDT